VVVLLLVLVLALGDPGMAVADGVPPTLASGFDPQRAFEHVRKQIDLGPRPAGSTELQRAKAYLVSEFKACGLAVTEQPFETDTPRGRIRFVNVIARPRDGESDRPLGGAKPRLLLASHYDTKWLPDTRFVGANDGASSTATLLEIARVIAAKKFQPKGHSLEFVVFDGEEAIKEYSSKDGLYGSRHYVEQAKLKSPRGEITHIRALILMDMIGDRELGVQLPHADADLTRRVYRAAETLGFRDYFHYVPHTVMDDHFPFVLEGVPSINLIDFEYGPDHTWWHTSEDTLDKLSPNSLKIVGQVVLKMIEDWK